MGGHRRALRRDVSILAVIVILIVTVSSVGSSRTICTLQDAE